MEANKDFETAAEINPQDPDIYYHRGQVMFIMGQFQEAIEQYKKSTEIDDTFIFSQIQHAVALYKDNRKERAEAKFKKLLRDFADAPEVYNYHGELFLDQASSDPSLFAKAIESFDKAVDCDKKKFVCSPDFRLAFVLLTNDFATTSGTTARSPTCCLSSTRRFASSNRIGMRWTRRKPSATKRSPSTLNATSASPLWLNCICSRTRSTKQQTCLSARPLWPEPSPS